MKIFTIGSMCCLCLALYGCTVEELAFTEMVNQSLQESSQMVQQTANQMNINANKVPLNNEVNFYRYSEPEQSASYLINTDEGLEHIKCMTLSSGYILCY
jgi:hypothetical protein